MGKREASGVTRSERQLAAPVPQPRQIVRFCVVFLVCVFVARFVLDARVVVDSIREPYCRWIAQVCGLTLRVLGVDAAVADRVNLVSSAGFQVKIAPSCDGLNATSVLAAGILAFPASWAARGVGMVLGVSLLLLINIARIVGLFLVGLGSHDMFEIVHVYVFQVFLITIAVGCFLVWARSVSAGHRSRRIDGDEVRA